MVYQSTLDTLELKKDKGTDYFLTWKSRGVYNSKLKPLYTAFLQNIKLPEQWIGINFDKDPLAVKQNNYLSKIVNVYIVYELYGWPKNPTNNFNFKNCLFGATSIVKSNDKEKYVDSDYGITFSSTDWWSFDNDTARIVIIFGVDNSLSSYAGNRKNKFFNIRFRSNSQNEWKFWFTIEQI